MQKILNLSHNKIALLPEKLSPTLPLESLDVGDNLLDAIPLFFLNMKQFNVLGNPLASIFPIYRSDNKKVCITKY